MVGSFTKTLLEIYCWVWLERISKISLCLAKISVRKLIGSSTMCAGHCAAERWKTRLRSNVPVWRAVTVITASCYNKLLASWKTSIKLVFSRPLVTRRLMPSVTVWTLTVCAHILLRCFPSWLLQLSRVGDSSVFSVWPL